ncbi:Cell shape-determining protein MreC [invertebrate metagenome]|uniref:Cell shape-determining protein MreC n=1 Tax=invertebrate metagenome TaxID=1711999 RepID=A0A2H9T9V5_9ZZZZ
MNFLDPVRAWLTVTAAPVQWLADMPGRLWGSAYEIVSSRSVLIEDNAELRAKNLILQQKVQKLASLTTQNTQLKGLLNASEKFREDVLVAEIIGIDSDPFSHIVTINKGSLDGVFSGQAVLDANGVMGQVIEASPVSSRITLVTDTSTRIPVINNRTSYRALATGTGTPDQLRLLHIPITADFQKDDLMITSGLGGIYPYGYPVGKIQSITHAPGEAFASITIQPIAQTKRSRLVMLVFQNKISEDQNREPADSRKKEGVDP